MRDLRVAVQFRARTGWTHFGFGWFFGGLRTTALFHSVENILKIKIIFILQVINGGGGGGDGQTYVGVAMARRLKASRSRSKAGSMSARFVGNAFYR